VLSLLKLYLANAAKPAQKTARVDALGTAFKAFPASRGAWIEVAKTLTQKVTSTLVSGELNLTEDE
jgi:hypothetical protein